jgi:prepilin-type N-terminal cleavage/methylation domain-containing protein
VLVGPQGEPRLDDRQVNTFAREFACGSSLEFEREAVMTRVKRRHGFTLIELLIVIMILALLATMLAGAAWKVLQRAKELECNVEMSEISTGLVDFKTRFGAFPPSNLTLTNNIAANPDPVSRQFLLKCWPRLQATVNWSAMGVDVGRPLSGDQVLVWALGGAQAGTANNGACLGFFDNSTDPTQPGGTRIRPFYEFASNRLINVSGRGPGFSYSDAYNQGSPYLYFAAQPRGNAYSADCKVVNGVTVKPYFDVASPMHYINPDSFQIICAGRNGKFGKGGNWSPQNADTVYPPGSDGSDDLANFYMMRMGTSPN